RFFCTILWRAEPCWHTMCMTVIPCKPKTGWPDATTLPMRIKKKPGRKIPGWQGTNVALFISSAAKHPAA
ncbi:hypothetical protein, partial [Gemmiger formicilis]|uniref:hypothetical protein n=1 Tax=Gemmiger formicilis TaxID=745368 RepID=UPI00195DBC1E